jgi:ABC-type branched-subunit amino acid transport system ATPase component
MTLYSIEVSGQEEQGVPSVKAQFGRVTVVLGANGTGKSRLLQFLRDSGTAFGRERPRVYVEGGRAIILPDQLRFHGGLEQATYKEVLKLHREKRSGRIMERLHYALWVLDRRGEEEKSRHSDAAELWFRGAQVEPYPSRPEPPLDRLFRVFAEALPMLSLEFDRPDLYARKGKARYPVSGMSDGEKQVLAILADIGILAEDNSVVMVDEPELNMHPNLAAQLWSAIEADRPNCIFIYATHSISFAMRESVDRAIVLSSSHGALELEDPSVANSSEMRPFLGAIPAILRSSRAVLVEGEDASFDAQFYRWVLDLPSIEIVPLGDCHQVRAATMRTGVWNRLAMDLKIIGVVDRDFRSDEQLKAFTGGDCHVLGLHEAESYLCIPILLVEVATKLKLVDPLPTVDTIVDAIIACARGQLVRTAATRTLGRTNFAIGVSVPRQALAACDRSGAVSLLRRAADEEVRRAGKIIDADRLEGLFDEELATCERAIGARSVDDLLRLFPGKQMASQLARFVGCGDFQQLAAAVRGHLTPTEFAATTKLRELLRGSLA